MNFMLEKFYQQWLGAKLLT